MTPVALGYLVYLQLTGRLTFGHLGWKHSLLLMAAGVVTVIPLLCFAAAATRLPLSTLGLLQYIAPTLQFLLGVLYFAENMSTARWIGFALVWLALVILTADRDPPGPVQPPCARSRCRTGLRVATPTCVRVTVTGNDPRPREWRDA